MDTAHFLLTRFNIAFTTVPAALGLSDDWLEHRFALFENFCLPSVLAQENKDFFWLLWMDERTPERWRARLQADLQRLPSAEVLSSKSLSEPDVIAQIERLTRGTSVQRIVTTRLDNDDAIARDYLASISRRAARLSRKGRYYVINYRNGCQVSQAGFFAVSQNLNPFLSVVSPAHPLLTALHEAHAAMNQFAKVLDQGRFSRRPLFWLQSLHGNNIANRLQGKHARIGRRDLERFSLGENWRQLLQQEKFAMPKGEVNLVQFAHRPPRLAPGRSQDPVCDITLSGLKGEYLFETIRREMAFYQGDLLQVVSFVIHGLTPGLMIDVGANIGNHTLFFAKVLAADVVSVEPNPAALTLLKSNVELNGIAHRVTIVQAAAWDARGFARLHTASLLNLGATQVVQAGGPETGAVVTMPLDELIAAAPLAGRVSLIKVAVEGFENRVLRGALHIIRTRRPILVVEAATAEKLREIEETLRPFRYTRIGPFCETTYVFGPSGWRLWRALLRRRLFRTASRLKRRAFKE